MPKALSIGDYDRRIVIQEEVTERNSHNEDEVTGWATFKTLYANVKDEDTFSNREYLVGDQITARRTLVFTVRHYKERITEKMRIVHDGDYYSIVSVSNPDRGKTTVIKALLQTE